MDIFLNGYAGKGHKYILEKKNDLKTKKALFQGLKFHLRRL